MKRGLITLMTVAIGLLSVQAMAKAPLIQDLPSVVVGNRTSSSQPVRYVYVDAFDLMNFATDDNTSTADLKWSYEIGAGLITPKFTINGNAGLGPGPDNPVSPPTTKQIAGPGATVDNLTGAAAATLTYTGRDALNNTVTIRNIALNPYGGPESTDMSPAAQDWNNSNNVQAVTFWCSDGNLASSSTVLFWTDNHYENNSAIGEQKLSTPAAIWTNKKSDNLNGTVGNKLWHAYDKQPNGLFWDHTTSHTLGGVGVCFAVTPAGNNWGSIQSPMPYFTLTQNTVYRIRCTMNSSQATVGKTPLWDFILENYNGDPTQGMNLYGMDSFYVDNEGGANTVLQTTNGTDIEMYWAPAAFACPQWTNSATGLWSMDTAPEPDVPRYAGVRDPCLRFRVLDVDNNASLKNDQKSGDICLQKVVVDAIGYNKCQVESNVVDITKPKAPRMVNVGTPPVPTLDPGNMLCVGLTGATAAYTSTGTTTGYVTITPGGSAINNELLEITPATDLKYTFPSNDILDNWPIPWQTGKIYRLSVTMDAPDAGSAASPWDVLWLSMEPPTNEIDTESFVTATKAIGTPKFYATPAPQTYMMFYYSGKTTKSTTPQLANLRWRVRLGNSSSLNWPNPSNLTNTGKVRIYSVKVDTVKFQ